MKENYDESLIDNAEYDEDMLFAEHVIKDDYDLLAIDGMLRNAYSCDSD
ncbi:MAG: hypothetical protein LIO79_05695 [Rikenellaceae bacterium]|nr:hypothetical protein [Rikenellaceae bacterium]